MSIGPIARALPTAYANATLRHHAEFVTHAMRMRKANAQSRLPFWDPHVFLGHRIATRLMRLPGAPRPHADHGTETGAKAIEVDTVGLADMAREVLAIDGNVADAAAMAARRAGDAWEDTAFDDELLVRRLSTVLAWSRRPVVVTVPIDRLASAWRSPWHQPVPAEALLALGPAAYYIALGPGFDVQGVQDQRLDHWIEGVFVSLDEHLDRSARQYDLNVVLLHYDLRDGTHDTTACIPLDPARTLPVARQVRLTQALADARRAPALATLAPLTTMRVVSLVLDVLPEVNDQTTSRRLAWLTPPISTR